MLCPISLPGKGVLRARAGIYRFRAREKGKRWITIVCSEYWIKQKPPDLGG